MLDRRCPKCGGRAFRITFEEKLHAFNMKLLVLTLVVGAVALIVHVVRSLAK